jgi:hypothetical protein
MVQKWKMDEWLPDGPILADQMIQVAEPRLLTLVQASKARQSHHRPETPDAAIPLEVQAVAAE